MSDDLGYNEWDETTKRWITIPTVTITQSDYNKLVGDSLFLQALKLTGVDNWDGYDDAREILNKRYNMIDNDKLEFAKLIVQIYSKYGSMIYQPAVRETYSKALKVIDDSLESNYHETK